jgi:hypothetical protein
MTTSISRDLDRVATEETTKKKNKMTISFLDSPEYELKYDDNQKGGILSRVVDSFKRDPLAHRSSDGNFGEGKLYDAGLAAVATAESPLARKLKGRNLQMIAIGGSIGLLGQCRTSRGYVLTCRNRLRSFRWHRRRSFQRRSCISHPRFQSCRRHDLLYHPRTGGTSGSLSRRRFLLRLFDSLHRSSVGLRYGLELCTPLDRRPPF